MFRTENILILREVRYQESDRILTGLSAESGKLTLTAHGALSRKSRMTAATQQLTYAELTLFEKNGRLTVREGTVKEEFQGLRTDLERLALGCYFAECLSLFAGENQPEPELLQLGLNCLFALSTEAAEQEKIKAAFELRLTEIEGYAPQTAACGVCGRADIQNPVFSPEDGQVLCRGCAGYRRTLPLTDEGLTAMRRILALPPKKLLAFHTEREDGKKLASVAEEWLCRCADRRLLTLDYYRKIRIV